MAWGVKTQQLGGPCLPPWVTLEHDAWESDQSLRPLWERWAGRPPQLLPALAAPFPRAGPSAGRSGLKGLIKTRVGKQSQAPMEGGQVRNYVWSLEGHNPFWWASIECLPYAEPSLVI